MRRCIIYIAFSFIPSQLAIAQGKATADFKTAATLPVNTEISSLRSPIGFGQVKEFPADPKRNRNYFKDERNSRWFSISIPYSGLLTFELSPYRLLDDYDWMLFKASPTLEQELLEGTAIPIRSNNSRNNPNAGSITGMKEGFANLYTAPGPNPAFSKAVEAIRGEQYFLIIDNIYEKGQGFKLRLNLKPTFGGPYEVVDGYVKDRKTTFPLKAEVIFEDDSTGFLITKTTTDSSGYYKVLLPARRPVNSTAINPGYLYGTEDLPVRSGTQSLNFYLDSIRQGNKVIMFNIHFQPNQDVILPNSTADLERLVAFLRRERNWKIKVIGHSNNNVFADASYLQKLSFNRSVSVKRYLVNNGISESRISCLGVGGKQPLIETRDPEEALRNLRVEIVLEKKL